MTRLQLYQQVETVGDKYMAVSGLPDECESHAACIARLALDMIEMADNVKMGNHPIVSLLTCCRIMFWFLVKRVTIGIHSGEAVTGVIGHRMPRYCLFGNTVNLTSRTETTGVPGRINVSEATYKWVFFTIIELRFRWRLIESERLSYSPLGEQFFIFLPQLRIDKTFPFSILLN